MREKDQIAKRSRARSLLALTATSERRTAARGHAAAGHHRRWRPRGRPSLPTDATFVRKAGKQRNVGNFFDTLE